MSAANGNPIPRINHELVRLLEAALDDAKAGRLVAGGVAVVLGHSQFAAFTATSIHYAEVIAAAEVMKSDVILKMRQPRGGLVRAALPGVPGGAALRN